MFLKKLTLVNFKNFPEASLEFHPQANALVGGNGEGKTNILDAVHYLSMCKSYFIPVDSQNIRSGEDFFMIQGTFDVDAVEENISCSLKRGQKKLFRRNREEYNRLADHIGLLPVVMISPTDTALITEGSEERRRFMDSIIAQYNPAYLEDLLLYGRLITQRNAYLKQAAQSRKLDEEVLSLWDDQLLAPCKRIYRERLAFIEELTPIFSMHYHRISGGREEIAIHYDSALNDKPLKELLIAAREKDRILQYTTSGVHKDDLNFLLNGFPVRRYASQGQQKSFLIALKLAQFDFIARVKGLKPVLLLDDIFDKLDENRVNRLMGLVSESAFGQFIITDSHPERIRQIFDGMGIPIRTFLVEKGAIHEAVDNDIATSENKHSA